MSTLVSPTVRLGLAALRSLLVLTGLCGVAYPLAMTGLAQVTFGSHANGSLVSERGRTVGSALIGQAFTRPVVVHGQTQKDASGKPLYEPDPAYFQSRPSAAGYDPLASGASNLGPESPDLVAAIKARQAVAAALDGVSPQQVVPDALEASGSGLDPDISPAYAAEQVARVARVRHLTTSQVSALVAQHTQSRAWGFLGEPTVNVLELNMALDGVSP